MRRLRLVAATAAALLLPLLFIPTAAQAQEETLDYVALGDSYASGSGAGSYLDLSCQRSQNAYPWLLSQELGADLDFAACGGAKTGDVLAGQVGHLDADTDLVSISVGGNDVGWVDVIIACILPFKNCTPDIEEAERKATQELPAKLDAVYAAIAQNAPNAEVYVLGYPRLFAAVNHCDALGLISIAEQVRINQAADLLSSVIESAAAAHGFTYVDVRDEFSGHEICGSPPWLHGLTVSEIPYHPNASGHSQGYLPALLGAL
ncbi:SGNH/GDSL hydrolase family protein [Glycomyces sp. NRRL B-16210]|uniref:SGNH/GDSL hydrolase family protein n=1 Tax=Glycomyces sp. NRRL B-16210 TaxID=1463821 RepID=UPI0004C1CAEA|nr:SGNH/GDSL hydrolase family protein [Glycomyces sp. NRRL B-16210]